MRRVVIPRALLGLVLASCVTPAESTAVSAIRGGETDNNDPAVGALSLGGLYAYCTAFLISHRTILTAGHCALTDMELELGTSADSPTLSIDVSMSVVHPMYTGEGSAYDLALMQLASDPGITPLPLNASALGSADVGRTIRHVGYGVVDDSTGSGGGTKRTVSYPITQIMGMFVYSGAQGEQTCTGDSGGPGLLMTASGEVVAGVVSDGPACQLSQPGWDDRVDMVQSWIVSTVSSWDAPPTFIDADGSATGSGSGSGSGSGGDNGSGSGSGGSGSGSGSSDGGGGSNASGSDNGDQGHAASGCSVGLDAPGLLVLLLPLVRRRRTR